jgi:hypothetical protein
MAVPNSGNARLRRLEAMQTFPIVRNSRHVYLTRTMFLDDNKDAAQGQAISFEITHAHVPADSGASANRPIELDPRRTFTISDDFDPMMAYEVDARNLRLISARTYRNFLTERLGILQSRLRLYEIDLDSKPIKPQEIQFQNTQGGRLELHGSWGRRPPLVIETEGEHGNRTIQLILSRSTVSDRSESKPDNGQGGMRTDNARIEFAVFGPVAQSGGRSRPFKLERTLSCDVTYRIKKYDRIYPCLRSVADVGSDRATPATQLQGAQLLVGRFAASSQPKLALVDACMHTHPLIIEPMKAGDMSVFKATDPPKHNLLERDVECQEIANPEALGGTLNPVSR